VLAIGLDGLEVSLAERLMAAGDMPALADLRKRAVRFVLDHGPAQRTGLAWEHVASGLSPEASGRWAAVEFDPSTYQVWQEGARFTPWWAAVDRRITDQALCRPLTSTRPELVSARLRNYQYHPVWGFIARAAWVR